MQIFRNILLAALAFISATATAEESLATQSLLEKLKALTSLQASFVQESYDANSKLLQKQTGTFKVTSKGEFVWDILKPYEQKIISDGETLRIFDPDLEQLTIKTLDKKTQVAPLLLFGGESKKIVQEYKITQTDQDAFELASQDKSSLFEKFQIVFKNGLPNSLVIIDSLKQKTLVTFDSPVANQAFKASTFQFQAPAGIELIDERKIDEH